MPSLQITVVDPPAVCTGYSHIELYLQMPSGLVVPVSKSEHATVFEVPFELKADRSGQLQPTGPAVQRQNDGRRFVYLAWCGDSTSMFRRLKVFFDKIPGFPGPLPEYHLRVKGTDKRGGPACATAEVLTLETP